MRIERFTHKMSLVNPMLLSEMIAMIMMLMMIKNEVNKAN